jgi:uncharacterized repeat protein (TIGR01451 family)
VAPGATAITATAEGVSGAAQLTVTPAVPVAIEITPSSSSLTIGGTIQLSAVVRASDGGVMGGIPLTWSSLQPAIATVNASGLVQGVALGTATITAAGAGLTGSATVIVALQPVVSVSILPGAPVLAVQDTVLLTAVLLDGSGNALTSRPVQWSSANPAIAAVAPTGPIMQQARLVGVAPGTTSVIAVSEGKADTVVATVLPKADLVVTKSVSGAVVSAGDTLVFTVAVTNAGPNAAANVILTDTLPANAAFVSATGSPVQSGSVLTWPVVPSLAVGAVVSRTVRLIAPAAGTVTNIAAATSPTAEKNPADNRAQVATGVNVLVDLVTTKSGPASVDAGDTITSTVRVRNAGPSVANAVTVTDTLPANAKYVATAGTPNPTGGVITWPAVASLAAGDSLLFTVRVEAPATGAVTNIAAAVTTTNEAVKTNNRAAATTAVRTADLGVTKTGPASVTPGDTIVYTLTVNNGGPGRATGVVLTDTLPLPATATFLSATGNPTQTGNAQTGFVLSWSVGTMAVGGSVVQTVRVLAPAAGGTAVNIAAVTSATTDANPSNNKASFATSVLAADLAVAKTGPATANAGDTLLYVITVTNGGPGPAAAVVVTDTLPANATFLSATGGATTPSGGVLTWPAVTSLAVGATITDTVRVRAPAAGGTVTNVAAAVSSTVDLAASNNRASAPTVVTPLADLAVTKTGPASVGALQILVDTVKVRNLGPSTAAGVMVFDTLPANALFIAASGGPSVAIGPPAVLTWNVGNIVAGDSVMFTITLQAPTLGSVSNTARATTTTAESSAANNLGSVTTTVGAVADLAVTKTGPAAVSAGQTFVDTVKVRNLGPSDAIGVQVFDSLPGNATFVGASGGPVPSAGLLTWNLLAPIAAGDSVMFTVSFSAPAAGGTVTNVATATTATAESNTANNKGSVTTTVGAVADLALSKSGPATANAGDTLLYVITVTNNGPSPSTNVVVTDNLPATAQLASATGAPDTTGHVLKWPAVPSLANGASIVDTVRVIAPAGGGTLVNVAAVTASTADPDPANNSATVNTAAGASADLEVTKTGPSTVSAADTIVFTVRVRNLGPSAADSVVVTDNLPGNATFINATGTPVKTLNVLTWPTVPALTVGDSLVYTVRVEAPTTSGTVTNVAAATSATTDVNPANNTDAATTGVGAAADLAVTKSGPATVNAGQVMQYVITVQNLGPSVADGVVRTDTLPGGVGFVSATGTPGPNLSGNVVSWSPISLAAGASVTDTVTITAPAAGVLNNIAAVVSSVADPVAGNNKATVATTINPADLALTKSGPATALAGETVTYDLSLANQGPGRALGITVSDTLPAGTALDSAATSAGFTRSGNVLSWTVASVDPGPTISYTVVVTAPATGTFVNAAAVTAATTDPDASDNHPTVSTTVLQPDLAVTKTGPAAAGASDTLVYTITVTNTGTVAATNVVVSDTLPGNATFVDATGTYTPSGTTLTWDTVPSLANGASIAHTVRVVAPALGGTVVNVAAATSSTAESSTANNASSVTTTVASPTADLVVTKAGPATAVAGDTLVYGLEVVNAGPDPAVGVILSDTLPANADFADASGSYVRAGNILTWSPVLLAPGDSIIETVRIVTKNPSNVTNTAAATSSTADPNAANNVSSVTTDVSAAPSADLAVSIGASADTVNVGDTVVYTIEVTNAGPDTATGVQVTEALPSNVAFVDATDAISPDAAGVLAWVAVPGLAPGDKQSFTVRVSGAMAGAESATASVASVTTDPSPASNAAAATTTVL